MKDYSEALSKNYSGQWKVTVQKASDVTSTISAYFDVVVAEIPSDISFVNQGDSITFRKDGEEEIPEQQVICKVSHVRPAPTFQWSIGNNDFFNK